MKYLKKNLSQCQFSTINPAWTSLGSNPGLHDDRHATVVKIYTVVFWVTTYYYMDTNVFGEHMTSLRGACIL